MKFTETTTETQTSLLAVALVKAIDHVSEEYGESEGKKFASSILKSIGLTDKEFKSLFNPSEKSDKVQSEISAVTKTNKEMFHMLQLVYRDGETEDTIMNNQCGYFEEIKPLLSEVKALGIVDSSILPKKNAFSQRCFIAKATYRFNKVHGTRHGLKEFKAPKQTAKTKKG
jgi:hypothetical protein